MFGRHQQQAAGRVVERVELAEHLAAEEPEHGADLGPGDARADGLADAGGRALLLGHLRHEGREQDVEALGVGADPAGPVHDVQRCRRVGDRQPGVLTDQAGRLRGVLAQLRDHRVGLRAADLGTGTRQARADRDRELPVDHLRGRHGCEPTEQWQPRPRSRRPRRAPPAAVRERPGSGTRSAISTNAAVVPSRSVTSPARALVLRSVPVFARTWPRAGGAVLGEAVLPASR